MPSLANWFFPQTLRPREDVLRTGMVWEVSRAILLDYYGIFHCVRFRGTHNLPPHGPVIFAPNHVSYYDATLVPIGIPYRVRAMAWEAFFRIPGLGWLMTAYGAYPVKVRSADKSAVEETLKLLRRGQCVIIFPEGTRSATGDLQAFQSGVARLALQTGATIVPVTITGGFEAWPRHSTFPRPGKVMTVKYHSPIEVQPPESRGEIRNATRELTAAIERPIRRRMEAYWRVCGRPEPVSTASRTEAVEQE
jgi:1-acyl-sn-glycerol-3-phosphate acyltransferase